MPSYTKLINGLTDLGIHKMQEHLDFYIAAVNNGEKSFISTWNQSETAARIPIAGFYRTERKHPICRLQRCGKNSFGNIDRY